jgi:hypothetical protein
VDEHEIQLLLNDADRPPPTASAGLAARVRERDRRGRRVRRVGAGVVVLMLIGVAAVVAMRHGPVDAPKPTVVVNYRGNLDQLAGRIRDRRETIDALVEVERRVELAKQMSAYAQSADMTLDADRDRAAGALLEYAAEMRKRAGGQVDARNEYRKVIELFPDSPLALAAREGLKGIEN